jgi:hypothetical protein
MYPNIESFLARVCAAIRTDLRGSVFIDPAEIDILFPTHPTQDINELPESRIEAVFRQHPPSPRTEVDILYEYPLRLSG